MPKAFFPEDYCCLNLFIICRIRMEISIILEKNKSMMEEEALLNSHCALSKLESR
jgi:hypothetical protein